MKILVFDTETTGKANFSRPPSDPVQPRVVQLGALLCDETTEYGKLNILVKPDGWIIPVEASAIHGITTEKATAEGVSISDVMQQFDDLAKQAEVLVAHNSDFDIFILEGEYFRLGRDGPNLPVKCTMHAATPICKLPSRRGYKWPKLIEAYQHAFKESFEGAHDAFADVRACARLYFWLAEQKAI